MNLKNVHYLHEIKLLLVTLIQYEGLQLSSNANIDNMKNTIINNTELIHVNENNVLTSNFIDNIILIDSRKYIMQTSQEKILKYT